MSYTLDTFRMDIATYLCDDPTATISVQMMMSFAQPLFEDIRNECPALFERLKYFVNTIPATAMSINASAEFPRFGIVGVRCDTEAGLCNSRELKQFLSTKNLLFTERRKDRFGAIQECEKVDVIVREQMRQCEIYSEPIAVKCTWIRNRSSDMIFVSPLTLMLAIMYGQNTGEFKRYAGILYMMILIVENEQSSALKSVVSKQTTTINELSHERDELMNRLEQILETTQETYRGMKHLQLHSVQGPIPSSRGWFIKSMVAIVLMYAASWIMPMIIIHRPAEHFICQSFQLPSSAWTDNSGLPMPPQLPLLASDTLALDNAFFNSVATMAQEVQTKQTMAMCAMFTPEDAMTWKSQFAAPPMLQSLTPSSAVLYSVDMIQ